MKGAWKGFFCTLQGVILLLSSCCASYLPPIAVINASPTSGESPLEVTFDISSSYDPDGTIVSYELDFGDGTAPATGSDLTQPITHTYSTAGTFIATLTVTDDDGVTGMDSVAINVAEPALQGKIVFSSDRSGNYDIWVMNIDGSGLQQLTSSPCREENPHWSPDGTKIAYTNWCDGIHVMNADGTGDVLVPNTDPQVGATGPDLVFDWGPCDKILFSTENPDGVGAVYEINPDGTGRRMLTDGWDGDHPTAGWSPDCTKFTFSEGTPYVGGSGKVAISPVSAFNPTIIYPFSSHAIEWSPDGQWILFLNESGAISKIRPDGTDASQVIDAYDRYASFTSNSYHIVYSDNGDLWITDLNGSTPVQLTSGLYIDVRPDVRK